MRFLLGYHYYDYPFDIKEWVEVWLSRLRSHGILIDSFCLTLNPPGPRLLWRELETFWRRGDKRLLAMYESLAKTSQNYDVLINWNGINLHPDFIRQLDTFNVYACFDDPESSENLSKPVSAAYDLSLVANIAEVDTYLKWGVKEARFWPYGFREDDYDPSLTSENILNGRRDIDIALLCERTSHWRKKRLDKFAAAFSQGSYYGKGWPGGFLAENKRIPLLQRAKIGINIHNSTGPVNARTYYLPANGVMQVCDNKANLGKLFELGKEAVGFDNIEEAIELCHYYLAHEDERRQIAACGWKRALKDYNELAVFKLLIKYIEELDPKQKKERRETTPFLHGHYKRTAFRRNFYILLSPLKKIYHWLNRIIRKN